MEPANETEVGKKRSCAAAAWTVPGPFPRCHRNCLKSCVLHIGSGVERAARLVKYRCKLERAHNEAPFNNAFDLNRNVMKIITSLARPGDAPINGRRPAPPPPSLVHSFSYSPSFLCPFRTRYLSLVRCLLSSRYRPRAFSCRSLAVRRRIYRRQSRRMAMYLVDRMVGLLCSKGKRGK